MPPWLLVDTQPDTLDTRVTRDTPVTCVTRDTRIPMGTGKENDAPAPRPVGCGPFYGSICRSEVAIGAYFVIQSQPQWPSLGHE